MKPALIFLFSFHCVHALFAQSPGDSLRDLAIQQIIQIQKDIIGENSFISMGREYPGFNHQLEGDPYFLTDTMTTASIYNNGFCFRSVRMLYDILLDGVITYNSYKKQVISLASEKIDSFRFLGHLFVRLLTDSSNMNFIKTGFYDRPYAGRSAVFVRQIKYIIQPINPRDPSRFVQKTNYFIRRNNRYYPVDSQTTLLDIFPDKKKQVKAYLRLNKLKYRNKPEYTLVRAAQYYDQLN